MAARKPIYMETTTIPADRTAAEISACLVQAGASTIHTRYENGKISGLDWSMRVGPAEIRFAMPARVEPLYQTFCKRKNTTWGDRYFNAREKAKILEQAERVAWRQLLRWVQAQLAMIEVGMVKSAEVFMPYMQQADGRTFFEYFEAKQLSLPAPEDSFQ
jgi:hypothetical protein